MSSLVTWSSRVLVLALILALAVPIAAAAAPPVSTLVGIRAAHHPGFDRIVFEFDGPVPRLARARWATQLRLDPSDMPARVQGNAFIGVVFSPAIGHEETTPYGPTFGPRRRAFDLPNIAHVVLLGDYEGYVSLGIGLMARTRIIRATTLRDPSRFVLDVSSRYRKGTVKVYFADEQMIVGDEEPYVRGVQRKVPRGDRAEGALQRLYAGPTQSEKAQGLRFLASSTTGFRDLRVNRRGVARVTLKGSCNSGGSAIITVGTQIMATLRSRPAIDWVKIYDRDGVTAFPWGRRDSIPPCLEP